MASNQDVLDSALIAAALSTAGRIVAAHLHTAPITAVAKRC
jgi:hypothetical protein